MTSIPTRARILALSLFASVLLGGCGNPSANSPPSNAAVAPAPAPQAPAPPETAPAQSGQNASVAELLSGSSAAAPAAATAPGATDPASTPASSAAAPPAPLPADVSPGAADAAPIDDVDYARVVSVTKIAGPRQVCTDRTVVERRKQQDEHRVAGTVIGAIAGGLLGNKIGRGRGRTVATVGGAVAGGAIGREVQGSHQAHDTVTRVVKHCRPVQPSEQGQDLYDVVYSYQGQTFHARLDYDPGDRIALPVRSVD
jgi:uncharacterized protein YcfJ